MSRKGVTAAEEAERRRRALALVDASDSAYLVSQILGLAEDTADLVVVVLAPEIVVPSVREHVCREDVGVAGSGVIVDRARNLAQNIVTHRPSFSSRSSTARSTYSVRV